MARKRLPAEERRKQIIRAAIHVFAKHGYAGSTTREIAEQADIAEALLYRYFSGKKELFVESMKLTADRLIEQLVATCEKYTDQPDVAITNLLLFYRQTIEQHEDFAKMVFVISAELDDDEVRKAYLPYQERTLQVLEDAIENWQKRKLINDDVPPRASAWVIFGCFHTVALMKHTGHIDELHLGPAIQLVRTVIMQN